MSPACAKPCGGWGGNLFKEQDLPIIPHAFGSSHHLSKDDLAICVQFLGRYTL